MRKNISFLVLALFLTIVALPLTAVAEDAPAPAPVSDPSGASIGGAADVIGATTGAPTKEDMPFGQGRLLAVLPLEGLLELPLKKLEQIDLGAQPFVIELEIDVRHNDVVPDIADQIADELKMFPVLVAQDAVVQLVAEAAGVAFEKKPILLGELAGRVDLQHAAGELSPPWVPSWMHSLFKEEKQCFRSITTCWPGA